MSLFTEIMSDAGGSVLFDTSGDQVTHVPREGDEAAMTALLGDVETIERQTSQGKVKVQTRSITVWNIVHATYGGVVNLRLDDSFSIAGELWSVVAVGAKSGTFWKPKLEKTSQRHKTREQAFQNS